MPKYAGRKAIISEIQNRIKTGRLAAGQRLPSERRLAMEFGVSRASVQGAIVELQSLGILDRTPNCRPVVLGSVSASATQARTTKDQIAVWIYPTLDELGATTMLQGMRTTLGAAGYHMVIGCAESDDLAKAQHSEEAFLLSLVDKPSIAGAIVWQTGSRTFPNAYQTLVRAKIPLVFVDREPPEPILSDVVSSNHRRAARAAVKHLLELGHRKIAMIVNRERVSSVEDRIEGYASVLRDNDIPVRDDYIIHFEFASRQLPQDHAQELVDAVLGLPDPPTAIFAVNDQIALFLMDALSQRGCRIPDDISIVGFDWLLRWIPSGGSLTTIAQPFEAIGREAAKRLLVRIDSDTQDPPMEIMLDAPLIVRQSTAAPKGVRVTVTA